MEKRGGGLSAAATTAVWERTYAGYQGIHVVFVLAASKKKSLPCLSWGA